MIVLKFNWYAGPPTRRRHAAARWKPTDDRIDLRRLKQQPGLSIILVLVERHAEPVQRNAKRLSRNPSKTPRVTTTVTPPLLYYKKQNFSFTSPKPPLHISAYRSRNATCTVHAQHTHASNVKQTTCLKLFVLGLQPIRGPLNMRGGSNRLQIVQKAVLTLSVKIRHIGQQTLES
jgi:hypothetical protein